ncbi:DUF6668 family protein [Streptomyces olivaceoviridis]
MAVAVTAAEIWTRGPVIAAPPTQNGPAVPARTAHARHSPPASLTWVGAHGGAGVTTLARQLGGTDRGTDWPDDSAQPPTAVLLVARTHAAGLQSASRALDALSRRQPAFANRLAALVLVADAPGRLPLSLGRRVRVLRSAIRVVPVPWIAAWRTGDALPGPPKEIRELAALTKQLSNPTGGHP